MLWQSCMSEFVQADGIPRGPRAPVSAVQTNVTHLEEAILGSQVIEPSVESVQQIHDLHR